MSVGHLVAYLFIASWIGALWQGATNLMLQGRALALVPVALSAAAVVGLVLIIRRDRRQGRLK